MREGLDKRGARSRLDRRRSLKEAIKRRAHTPPSPSGAAAPGFTDEDLRFRQLTRRRQPATRAVVFFLMDVSGSMSADDRQLAKTFFFWVAAGLRRQYRHLDTVFVAHTTEAHEFGESEFFQVTGTGGTVASTGFAKVQQIMDERFNPASCNVYLFYASDGDNASEDQEPAHRMLEAIARVASYAGYVEIRSAASGGSETPTARLYSQLAAGGLPCGSFAVSSTEEIWGAVRHFFSAEAQAAGAAP
jgi:uncharacterized protein